MNSNSIIGLLLAPGAKNDLSMNQYARENLGKKLLPTSVVIEDPPLSTADIESAMSRLIRESNCTKIFCLGPQCKPAISHYLRNSISGNRDIDVFMIEDASVGKTDRNIKLLKKYDGPNQPTRRLWGLNYYESAVAEGFGMSVANLADRYEQCFGLSPRVAFVGGASVPTVKEWYDGFVAGYKLLKAEHPIIGYTLGSGYSKFDDPWSAYELTNYLIESHGIDIFVQVCGASCKGMLVAIHEKSDLRKTFFVPFDYDNWNGTLLERNNVPLACVRSIDEVILLVLKHGENIVSQHLKTGQIREFEGTLGIMDKDEREAILRKNNFISIERS